MSFFSARFSGSCFTLHMKKTALRWLIVLCALYSHTALGESSLALPSQNNITASDIGDEDTILVESGSASFSYNTALQALSKNILGFDLSTMFKHDASCREAVMRSFSEISERTSYRLNLKRETLELQMRINF